MCKQLLIPHKAELVYIIYLTYFRWFPCPSKGHQTHARGDEGIYEEKTKFAAQIYYLSDKWWESR